jgi:hypothetical protein
MILIVTNRQDQTADFLILELRKRKTDYFRFNTEDYPRLVSATWDFQDGLFSGKLEFQKRIIPFNEISSIWYRRPVSPVINASISNCEEKIFAIEESKAFLEGIWRILDCFWVSNPDALSKAENKLYQLKIANNIGFEVWPTLVTNSPLSLSNFYTTQGDIIYKPLRGGRLHRANHTSLIFTNQILSEHKIFFDNIRLAPGLFQKYIPKLIELRVTVIGHIVFAVEIHSQANNETLVDWRRVNSDTLLHKYHNLPSKIEQLCKELIINLNLQFGAIDLILTPDGKYIFLEINPNGQWAWIQQMCPKIPLRETLADLLMGKIPH